MTLTPVEGPTTRPRKLKAAIEAVLDQGTPGQWYLITRYEKPESARSAAYRLRSDYPALEIQAEKGSVYARKVEE